MTVREQNSAADRLRQMVDLAPSRTTETDAALTALAPDMALLLADMAEQLERILSPWKHIQEPTITETLAPARAVLERLDALVP